MRLKRRSNYSLSKHPSMKGAGGYLSIIRNGNPKKGKFANNVLVSFSIGALNLRARPWFLAACRGHFTQKTAVLASR